MVVGLLVALTGVAAADPPAVAPPPVVDSDQKLVPPEKIDRGPGWSWRLAEKMTLAGDELSLSLRALTFDTMDLKFDGHTRHARMRMNARRPATDCGISTVPSMATCSCRTLPSTRRVSIRLACRRVLGRWPTAPRRRLSPT